MLHDPIFSPSFGNRPSTLVGRDKEVNEFLKSFDTEPGNRQRAMILLGQRGSGKTVLLWEFAERAAAAGFVVATPTTTGENLLQRIIEKIQDKGEAYVHERKCHVQGGNLGALGFSAGLQFTVEVQETKSFQYKLSRLCDRLEKKGHGIVILIDEVQANNSEIRELVSAYQELIGERKNIILVMAGLPSAVSATLNDSVLTFLNRAYKIELGPLADADVDAFLAYSFERLNIFVDDDIRHQAVSAIAGSPYLLQLLGHNMVLLARGDEINNESDGDGGAHGEKAYMSHEAFNRARKQAVVDFQRDICVTTIKQLSDGDISFLKAAAKVEENSAAQEDSKDKTDEQSSVSGENESKMADISKEMGVTSDYAQKYRKRLLEAGVITSPRRGYVRIDVPFLADYMRNQL